MRCLNCNCEVPDKSVFCPECGQKFEGGNTYWRRPQSQNDGLEREPESNFNNNMQGGKKHRNPIIIIIVAIVALAGGTIFFSMRSREKDLSQHKASDSLDFRQSKIGAEETVEKTEPTSTPVPTVTPTETPEEPSPTPTEAPEEKKEAATQTGEVAGPPLAPETTPTPQTEENGALTPGETSAGITDLAVKEIVDPSQISATDLDKYFQAYEIVEGDEIYNRIIGKSYYANDYVALSDLRYLKVLHYNFEGQVQVGELIVNAQIVDDFLSAFKQLYEKQYQIQEMVLIDNYWAGDGDSSDYNSIEHNNTSAFCFRNATGSGNLSKHAFGRAIDINSQQNPYVTYNNGYGSCAHGNAQQYLDRSSGLPHVITHDDICYQIFTQLGFTWGGDWSNPKDFQHFEKSAN